MSTAQPPRVFISYSHDSDAHRRQVLELCELLRSKGVDAWVDQYLEHDPPEIGWPDWCEQEITRAAFVLCVFTETYRRRYDRTEEPGTGLGVTWEGFVIRSAVYLNGARNRKFIPLLLGDAPETLLPDTLRVHGFYRYPAAFGKLYSRLTRQAVAIPGELGPIEKVTPATSSNGSSPHPAAASGQSSAVSRRVGSPDDPLLFPNRDVFIGREEEKRRILAFLDGPDSWATVFGTVTGTGGIGKTELCKAALREWLAAKKGRFFYYVSLTAAQNASDLLFAIGLAVGAPEAKSLDEIFEQIKESQALFYLDNLESVVDDPGSLAVFAQLKKKPGIRILTSSRVQMDGLGATIAVGTLPDDDAVELFLTTWNGAGGGALAPAPLLREFVGASLPASYERTLAWNLGAHPLSIVLVASHGREGALEEIIERWNQEGLRLASLPFAESAQAGSLDISLSLTLKSVRSSAGTVELWGVAALFPEGLSKRALAFLRDNGGPTYDDRDLLLRYNVISRAGERFKILPPLARFAEERARAETDGFSLRGILARTLDYATGVARHAAQSLLGTDHLESLHHLLDEFPVLHRLVLVAGREGMCEDALVELGVHLQDFYLYRTLFGAEILEVLVPCAERNGRQAAAGVLRRCAGEVLHRMQRPTEAEESLRAAVQLSTAAGDVRNRAYALDSLGYLEQFSWRLESAEELYATAAQLFEVLGERRGLGTVRMHQGDLAAFKNDLDDARLRYTQAEEMLGGVGYRLGQAHALTGLGDLEFQRNDLPGARELYLRAQALYEAERYDRGRARLATNLGLVEGRLRGIEAAREHYNRALEIRRGSGDELELAELLLQLADEERGAGNVDRALDHAEEAGGLFEKKRQAALAGYALLKRGEIELQIGRLGPSFDHVSRALETARSLDDARLMAWCYMTQATIEFRRSDHAAAMDLITRARDLFHGADDHDNYLQSIVNLGVAEHHFGSIDEARRHFQQGMHLAAGSASPLRGVEIGIWMADLHRRCEDLQAAEHLYQEAYRAGKEWRADGLVALVRVFQGDLKVHQHAHAEAQEYYNEVLRLSQKLADPQSEANSKRRIAELLVLSGEDSVAARLLDEAEEYYRKIGERLGVGDILKARADLQARLGNRDTARELYEQAIWAFQELNSLGRLGPALRSLAALDAAGGDAAAAIAGYERAGECLREQWEYRAYVEVCGTLSALLRESGDPEGAERWTARVNEARAWADQVRHSLHNPPPAPEDTPASAGAALEPAVVEGSTLAAAPAGP